MIRRLEQFKTDIFTESKQTFKENVGFRRTPPLKIT